MTSHIDRVRKHFDLETRSLQLAAERSRLLDHNGSRGSDVEHTIREWLRRLVAPHFTVSSGEIIDSYDTDADLKSRQQDIVIHQWNAETNKLVLPSGLRLIPIETVALVVEVKLTLDADEFETSDRAAEQTSRLRLAVLGDATKAPNWGPAIDAVKTFNEHAEEGTLLSRDEMFGRIKFAVFAIEGIAEVDTLVRYVRNAKAVNLVTCLTAGSAHRMERPREFPRIRVFPREDALLSFAAAVVGATSNHLANEAAFPFQPGRYYDARSAWFWEDTDGYEFPAGYQPDPAERADRAALFPEREFKT